MPRVAQERISMEINRQVLVDLLNSSDHAHMRILSHGPVGVVQYGDRIFLVNRLTNDAVEVVLDFAVGFMLVAI